MIEITDPTWKEFAKSEYPQDGDRILIMLNDRTIWDWVWKFGVVDWRAPLIPIAWKKFDESELKPMWSSP